MQSDKYLQISPNKFQKFCILERTLLVPIIQQLQLNAIYKYETTSFGSREYVVERIKSVDTGIQIRKPIQDHEVQYLISVVNRNKNNV